jgi:hypothetical protein
MSAKSPVKLSVHRNTVEARRKRVLAKDLARHVEAIVRENDIRAYAVVGIGSDGQAYAVWDTGAVMPMWAFPATIAHVLEVDMRSSDAEDDWRPKLA